MDVDNALRIITETGSLPGADWPDQAVSPDELGLALGDNAELFWPHQPDRLDRFRLQEHFPDHQLLHFEAIGSTNTHLMTSSQSMDGRICTSEMQLGGRGRRGRSWLSPYARNLAISVGRSSRWELAQLGGLSSVTGLAIVEELQHLGAKSVEIKWPNDVLIDGRKVCGILVELRHWQNRVEYVVGFGVNVSLTDTDVQAVDQPVSDLRQAGIELSRTDLFVALVKNMNRYLSRFEEVGFGAFVSGFNAVHRLHREMCNVFVGDEVVAGVVTGIGEQGELIVDTESGEQRFHGGEVSVRPQDI